MFQEKYVRDLSHVQHTSHKVRLAWRRPCGSLGRVDLNPCKSHSPRFRSRYRTISRNTKVSPHHRVAPGVAFLRLSKSWHTQACRNFYTSGTCRSPTRLFNMPFSAEAFSRKFRDSVDSFHNETQIRLKQSHAYPMPMLPGITPPTMWWERTVAHRVRGSRPGSGHEWLDHRRAWVRMN